MEDISLLMHSYKSSSHLDDNQFNQSVFQFLLVFDHCVEVADSFKTSLNKAYRCAVIFHFPRYSIYSIYFLVVGVLE